MRTNRPRMRSSLSAGEPIPGAYLIASFLFWFGTAWLVADLVASPEHRRVNPRPILGLLATFGYVGRSWLRTQVDSETARLTLVLLLLVGAASSSLAVCFSVFGLAVPTRLYPDPTPSLYRAWAMVDSAVAVGAFLCLRRDRRLRGPSA